MQPLQKRCPHGVCTASRRAIKQIGHSYLLSKGGSNSTSYPCVSSVKELGGLPVPLPTLTLSSFAPPLQALAMAVQQPLSKSRPPQLLSLCSKLIAAGQVPHRTPCKVTKRCVNLKYSKISPSSCERIWAVVTSSRAALQIWFSTQPQVLVLHDASFYTYLVMHTKEHSILSLQKLTCTHLPAISFIWPLDFCKHCPSLLRLLRKASAFLPMALFSYPYGAIFFQSIQRVSMKSTVMECSNMSAPYFPCNDRCYLISSVHKGLQYRFQLSLGAYPQIEGRPGQPHQQQRICCKWNANAQHCR